MKKLIILFILLIPVIAQADRAYMVLPVQGGSPVVGETKASGWVLIEMYKTTALYQVTGTTEAITSLTLLPNALLISKVTEASSEKVGEVTIEKPQYSELAEVTKVDPKKVNDMLTAATAIKEPITDKDTNREAILKMVTNKNFERDYWVKDE